MLLKGLYIYNASERTVEAEAVLFAAEAAERPVPARTVAHSWTTDGQKTEGPTDGKPDRETDWQTDRHNF